MGRESPHSDELRRLLDITRQMAVTTDVTQLLETIVDATCDVLDCERATIFLYDAGKNELYSRVATGDESIRFPADRGIAGAAAQDRAFVNVPDAYADERFNQEIDRKTGFRTRNLLTFPLANLDNELMGVLQALNKRSGPFTASDESLARVLSDQAGVALHRQFLLDQYAEKQRLSRDLELARKIQQQLFPDDNPSVPGYAVAGWNRSADETGGDCYDFIPLDDGRLGLLLADATGHGISAALVIAQCRSLVRAMLMATADLSVVVSHINRVLTHDLTDDRFVTALVGILDPRRHRFEYVAAGQGPLWFVTADGVEQRTATGLPLAIQEDFAGDVATFDFAEGDVAAFLTDGFFEASDPSGEMYGEDRTAAFLHEHRGLDAEALISALYVDVHNVTRGTPQADDLTAVLLQRK